MDPIFINLIIVLLAGGILGWVFGRKQGRRRRLRRTLDLVRRAHRCDYACIVDRNGVVVTTAGDQQSKPAVVERVITTAKLAMSDRKPHVVREDGLIIAVGVGSMGAAINSPTGDLAEAEVDGAVVDLKRLLADLGAHHRASAAAASGSVAEWSEIGSPIAESVQGMSVALCETAREMCDRPTAVVVRDLASKAVRIVAISHGVDRRLVGVPVLSDSAAGRACFGMTPIEGRGRMELFGHRSDNRRRHDLQGVAFPLRDGQLGVGTLVVLGPIEQLSDAARELLTELAKESGPRIGSAIAVRNSDARVTMDEVTGLPKRQVLDAVMESHGDTTGSLILLDFDQLGEIAEIYGRTAVDATLKHLTKILLSNLRDEDAAARTSEGQFSLWLPDTGLSGAMLVAERVRQSVETTPWDWAGNETKLTCSIGVASCPTPTQRVVNLFDAALVALMRAQEQGRNRVAAANEES